jgi:hypothetical protein
MLPGAKFQFLIFSSFLLLSLGKPLGTFLESLTKNGGAAMTIETIQKAIVRDSSGGVKVCVATPQGCSIITHF